MSSVSEHETGKNSLSSKNTILEFRQAGFSYEKSSPFINDMSLSVGNGEFIGLLGANGSGKSTILKLASGILKASKGSIDLWGSPVRTYKNKDRAKLLSYLPQILDMNVPFTVRELVSMGIYPYEVLPRLTVDEAVEMVGLADKTESLISNLSGGERRRVYIAMTLLQGAGLLLLDEPLANLDIKYQIELLRLLKELREHRGITVVMALHDINIALQFEKIILVREGRILSSGNPGAVLTKELLKKAFDVELEIKRHDSGEAYINYENSF
ncbi:MAG TPA: ABC transporter ATP-binding protein [Nitrospirae bacterium]|nr:iron(3+)-hydroxamate import ATP-binding protein FhuC [bacterium BMS3Bbin08]HDH50094.1 ABC transporter ATP-binding protein [Nitrospirota bacterium]HDK16374.1 ABC transporter ATP-binding protein [Nitrospirota bacterium]HDK82327.1 ABC transporter ATP-binding protein [Nitrospirota bacterium]